MNPVESKPYAALCNLVEVFGWNNDDMRLTDLAGEGDDLYVDEDDFCFEYDEGIDWTVARTTEDIDEIFECMGGEQ